MSKVVWDAPGERFYETGVSHGMLYIPTAGVYDSGVPWNGLTAVTESPTGAEATPIYADNIKYLNLQSAEEFACTIEALYYPVEFGVCDGTAEVKEGMTIGQQSRKTFGFSYQTKLGNDVEGDDYGYKIHLVYGCLAAPSEKSRATVNDTPEAPPFSWEVTTTPVSVTGFKPSATVSFDSTALAAADLEAIEDVLYGTDGAPGTEPSLPLPDALAALIGAP